MEWFNLDETGTGKRFGVYGTPLTNQAGVTSVAGKIGNASSFANASSQYLWAPDSTKFNYGLQANAGIVSPKALSVSAWFKATSFPGNPNTIVARQSGSAGSRGFRLETSATAFQFTISKTGAADTSLTNTSTALVSGVWFHLVGVWSGATSGMTLYVNGANPSTNTNVATMWVPAGVAALSIGCRGLTNTGTGPSSLFNGAVDLVGLWSRALTANDVSLLYNGGAGLTYPFLQT